MSWIRGSVAERIAAPATPEARAVLDVRGVSVRIRVPSGQHVQAVDDVSFSVRPGETLAVVGESGCGKTMLAMAILGLLPAGGEVTAGEVLLDGEDLRRVSPSRLRDIRGREIGAVFQEPMTALDPVLSVGRQIGEVILRHESVSRRAARARVLELLALVGIPDPQRRIDQYPHELSGGMAQRVVIAMAIACGPRVLIADEPTTALDVTIQAAVLRVLDDLRRQLEMALVLITHDLGVVADVADRVMVMYAGRVVEQGGVIHVYADPRHQYTRGLLGAVRHPERTVPRSRLTEIPGVVPTLFAPATACAFSPRCPRADERCRSELPLLTPAGAGRGAAGHVAACFHPGGEPPEPPAGPIS
jgi:peptide/nickel transport system ATP-binding protein